MINNKRAALALSDYLNQIGVANTCADAHDGSNIYLENSEDIERARTETEQFLRNPNDPKYMEASWIKGKINGYRDPRVNTEKYLANAWNRAGAFTRAVSIISLLVFLLMTYVFHDSLFQFLRFPVPALGEANQWWRFLTPAIMHFSWMHIAFNLLAWWDFGGRIEKLQGPVRLISLFVLIATLSNLFQFELSGPNFGGLSGVLFGLFGYIFVYGKLHPLGGLVMRREFVMVLVVWLAFGFTPLAAMVIGPMANTAHLSGLICGAIFGLVAGLLDKRL